MVLINLKYIACVFIFTLLLDLSSTSNGYGHSTQQLPELDDWDDGGDTDFPFDLGFDHHPPHFRTMSSIAIKFAIMKGCEFVMASVKSIYYHDGSHDGGHDRVVADYDWRQFVARSCGAHHVPKELCCALIDCGCRLSLHAIDAPFEMLPQCNMTSVSSLSVDSSSLVGKRELAPSVNELSLAHDPHALTCDSYSSASLHVNVFGKRHSADSGTPTLQTPSNSTDQYVPMDHGSPSSSHLLQTLLQSFRQFTHGIMPTQAPIRGNMKHWCKDFSRSINKRYHFNEVKFVARSPYWLVDIYQTAHENHVPTNYTHGLVGCGMTYAMKAFNAEHWQTFLYSMVQQ